MRFHDDGSVTLGPSIEVWVWAIAPLIAVIGGALMQTLPSAGGRMVGATMLAVGLWALHYDLTWVQVSSERLIVRQLFRRREFDLTDVDRWCLGVHWGQIHWMVIQLMVDDRKLVALRGQRRGSIKAAEALGRRLFPAIEFRGHP